MKSNLLLRIAILFTIVFSTMAAEAGRIRLRKVPVAPKVCANMSEDKYLSRDSRRIFGTLRSSVIIEQDISLVDDLGKKICQWPTNRWQALGDLSKYTFYIDEQRNALYPYMKAENQYQFVKISLDDCSLGEVQMTDKLELPKCEVKKKARSKSKRKVASNNRSRA
ncbi:MAG: hypothetical protein V4654_11340 [Bdellovibrionota bacterium]